MATFPASVPTSLLPDDLAIFIVIKGQVIVPVLILESYCATTSNFPHHLFIFFPEQSKNIRQCTCFYEIACRKPDFYLDVSEFFHVWYPSIVHILSLSFSFSLSLSPLLNSIFAMKICLWEQFPLLRILGSTWPHSPILVWPSPNQSWNPSCDRDQNTFAVSFFCLVEWTWSLWFETLNGTRFSFFF